MRVHPNLRREWDPNAAQSWRVIVTDLLKSEDPQSGVSRLDEAVAACTDNRIDPGHPHVAGRPSNCAIDC